MNRIGADYSGLAHPLEAAAIARLNRIAHETSAVAVLTSSGRLMLPWPESKEALVAFGGEEEIVDETPDLCTASQDLDEARRGEIEAWLGQHEVEAFVVVDDHPIYAEGDAHFAGPGTPMDSRTRTWCG